jgi:hypothetical protein
LPFMQQAYGRRRSMTHRFLVAIFVISSLLTAPVVSFAATGEHRDRPSATGHQRGARRVYDRTHRDYHVWSANEERLLQQYFEQHHMRQRPFTRLSGRQQRDYWKWRHEHP